MTLPDGIGWLATSVFTASYLTRSPVALRRVQMAGASLWFSYGVVTRATPVMVANLLVLGAACWAEVRDRRSRATTEEATLTASIPSVVSHPPATRQVA
ncbi:MAG TPA: hypothetical protein VMF13_00200 [Luteitalea sp.]|nr:hypothetical protein [Luteitalea sp.]